MLGKCLFFTSTVVVHHDCFDTVGGFNKAYPFSEDYDMWLRLLGHFRAGHIPIPLTIRIVHRRQLGSQDRGKLLPGIRQNARRLYAHLDSIPAANTDNYVLGVDGGATRTLAWIADRHGTIIGHGEAGNSNKNLVNVRRAGREVGASVAQAIQKAGISSEMIGAAHYGLGGCDSPDDAELWRPHLSPLTPKATVTVENDVFLPIYLVSQRHHGLGVICGSGANAGLITRSGKKHHLQGRIGASSYHLGKAVLNRAVRELMLRKRSELAEHMVKIAGLSSPRELLTMHRSRRRRAIAGLASVAMRLAHTGHITALGLVREMSDEISRQLIKLISLDDESPPSVAGLPGSVCKGGGTIMKDMIAQSVKRDFPNIEVVLVEIEPVAGAVIAALRTLGYSGDQIIARIRETCPL